MNSCQNLAIIFTLFLLVSCASQQPHAAKLKFNKNYRLYTSDEVRYSAGRTVEALDLIKGREQPIVIFVHGRGKEPSKSLRGTTLMEGQDVHKLEQQYGLSVLLFNWDSKGFLLDRERPLSKMSESAEALNDVFSMLDEWNQRNGGEPEVVLLVHSMGSIVLQALVEKYGWNFTGQLFRAIVLSASDSDARNHSVWLEKISLVENIFVTVNYDDMVLRMSNDEREEGVIPLGRNPGEELAESVKYVDFTRLGKKKDKSIKAHEAFNKEAMLDQIFLCDFFAKTLVGLRPVFDSTNSEDPTAKIIKLRFRRDKNDQCFKSTNGRDELR